jgi:hypothetical protein
MEDAGVMTTSDQSSDGGESESSVLETAEQKWSPRGPVREKSRTRHSSSNMWQVGYDSPEEAMRHPLGHIPMSVIELLYGGAKDEESSEDGSD